MTLHLKAMGVVPSKQSLINSKKRHPLPLMKTAKEGLKALLSFCNSFTDIYV